MARFVIRRIEEKDFYSGVSTWGAETNIFVPLERAKIFKNIAGAKVACGDLKQHFRRFDNKRIDCFEIVEVVLNITDNIIVF